MSKPIPTFRKLTLFTVVAVLIGGYPMAVFADDAPAEEDPGYVYDATTGRWSSNQWKYDPATNTYIENTGPKSNNTVTTDGSGSGAITDTGPESNNQIDTSGTNTNQTNTNNSAQLDTTVNGQAKTGDAAVDSNTKAGGAGTGDATAIATIINQLNSASGLGGGQPYEFTMDIGDVHGDIVLAPQLLQAMANSQAQNNGNSNITYNVLDKNTLNNTVDLTAQSGNASVLNNTNAGSARSGNATAIANVLNLVNSIIAANKSFVGTINIHGNLDGDILISKDGSPSLIASNASNPLSQGNMIANSTNLTNIINDIDLEAKTGKATVDSNTNAGSAKSGTADTNLVVMNLAGRTVSAKNSLLVFVNVLGKWVGIIVDAPTGATAAVLGDDVTSNLIASTGPDSNNVINDDSQSNANINADSQTTINNHIKVGAQTGDATVSGNTNAGDATTGNAKAAATVFNMANSAFNVSDWFGVLFINVLGSWYGSFGVDTPQGDEVAASSPPPTSEQPVSAPAQVFSFIAHNVAASDEQQSTPPPTTVETTPPQTQAEVLSAQSSNRSSTTATSDAQTGPATVSMPVAIAALAGLTLAAGLVVRLVGMLRERFA